ncbi:MAG TPA: hypothetical protein VJZ27_11140, partial [Aggregatilineales bacterium]|nr:hypothetical protein [Aggregatilineales bacterium]
SEVVEIEVERPAENPEELRLMSPMQPEVVEISHTDAAMFEIAEPESAFPTINYNEPDEPDAVPVQFEEPEVPELHEEVTPDEAYEAFVEYMTELDQLEEKAYHEAVMAEARAMPPEERKEVVRQALLPQAEDESDEIDESGADVPVTSRFQASGNGSRSMESVPPKPETPPVMVTDYHKQHVISDHNVLVTGRYEGLQRGNSGVSSSGEVTYEDRWVVDHDSFIAGGDPDTEMSGNGKQESQSLTENTEPKKFKKPRRRTYFHIEFEHMGGESPRSRFAEEGRTIYINRDHPQVDYAEETEGVDSLAYRNLMNEIVIQEYASAVVKQTALTGFYVADPFDAVETIQAVVNRLALEAGYRMQDEGHENVSGVNENPASSSIEDEDDL